MRIPGERSLLTEARSKMTRAELPRRSSPSESSVSSVKRSFFSFSVRQLLLLIAAMSLLLAAAGPGLWESYNKRRTSAASASLIDAVKGGDLAAASRAISRGANPDACFGLHDSALILAAKNRDSEMVQLLLEAGAGPNTWINGQSVLHLAVRNNDLPISRALLAAGADPNQGNDKCLHMAISNGNVELVQALLEQKADPNARTTVSNPLQMVIESSHSNDVKRWLIQALVKHGSDLTSDSGPNSAISAAIRRSDAAMADVLVSLGAPYTAREAAAFNRLDELKRMVAEDRSVLSGRFEPYWAARPGQGPTLLGIALEFGNREMALYLLDAGAPVDGLEGLGGTLLHKAAIGGDPELVEALIARGLDVNAQDDYKDTPLREAAARGRLEAATALIQAGADVNLAGMTGITPLWSAIDIGHAELTEALLAAGADPVIANSQGLTAYDHARSKGREALLPQRDK